jgi:hypothetical protein
MGMSGQSYQKLAVKWDFPVAHYPTARFLPAETVVQLAFSMYDCLNLNSNLIILVGRKTHGDFTKSSRFYGAGLVDPQNV